MKKQLCRHAQSLWFRSSWPSEGPCDWSLLMFLVGLRTANSHVSSGQPPPERWALHHTAFSVTDSLHWIVFNFILGGGGDTAKNSSASQAEQCSNHILHVKVACDVSLKHVWPWIMAETDVSCLCTEGGERDVF